MKKKIGLGMCALLIVLAGCSGKQNETVQETEIQQTEMTVEEHIHTYAEEFTTEPACETEGVKTFTCLCGDSYTESVPALGHEYEIYVSNEDATYLADGTETAVCIICGATDTRTKENSKLEYTYKEVSGIKYAKSSVNVRNLPDTEGEKLGTLHANQQVTVTGQCNETGWYRIELNGEAVYVSNNYLSDKKAEMGESVAVNTDSSINAAGWSAENGSSTNMGNLRNPDAGSNSGAAVPDAGSGSTGNTAVPDSGNTNAGNTSNEAESQVPSEPVKNPNGYPEITFAEEMTGNGTLAPGIYYVVDRDEVVTIEYETNQGTYFDQYGNRYDHPVDAEGNPL